MTSVVAHLTGKQFKLQGLKNFCENAHAYQGAFKKTSELMSTLRLEIL